MLTPHKWTNIPKIKNIRRFGKAKKPSLRLIDALQMAKGRKVTVNMIDGTPYGPRIVEIGNWVGKAFFCPRTKVLENFDREEWDNPGVYCLRYEDPTTGKEWIYWGEAEIVRKRIRSHLTNSKMNWFMDVVFFVSKDHWLTKTQVKYLEYRLIGLAKDKRASLQNTATPTEPRMHETDKNDMEYFLEQMLLILPMMGFRFMIEEKSAESPLGKPEFELGDLDDENEDQINEALPLSPNTEIGSAPTLRPEELLSIGKYNFKGAGIKATMDIVGDDYIVRKGSQAKKNAMPSLRPNYVKLRQELIDSKVLEDEGEYYLFTCDHKFKSSSTASNIISGVSSAGTRMWVDEQGMGPKGLRGQ